MSVRDVAATYQIHRTTALDHLHRAGIPRRPTQRRLTDADLTDARQRRQERDSYAAIAADYDVHPETVRRALLRQTP